MAIEIKRFDGDLQQVSRLIKASWADDYQGVYKQPVMDYASVDFLEWNLKRQNADPDLLLGAYSGNRLIAFGGGFPHKLRFNDIVFNSVVSSFLTTHVDFKRTGIAKSLIREALLVGIEKGYDINTCILDEGHAVEGSLKTVSKEMKIRLLRLYRFTFLSKPLDKKKIEELARLSLMHKIGLQLFTKRSKRVLCNGSAFDPKRDASFVRRMLNDSYRPNTLAVEWDMETFTSQFEDRMSKTWFINRDSRMGMINYYTINLIGCRSTPRVHKMTMIDNVSFGKMSLKERHRFVADFCADQKKSGSCIVNIPTSPVFDLVPFYSNLFIPSGRYHWYYAQDPHQKLVQKVQPGYLFFR